jgi:type II secretory pathway pseudopilin PulG
MKERLGRQVRGQGGYTLVELIITVGLSAALMVALTSVVLTSTRAVTTASDRVEASGQIRSFQYFAYDDFTRSALPNPAGCGTPVSPCSTQQIVLAGTRVSNTTPPVATAYTVTYAWDGSNFVDRQDGSGATRHAASGVSAFAWYVDSGAAHPTVVVAMTITVGTYSESQTLRFLPRLSP